MKKVFIAEEVADLEVSAKWLLENCLRIDQTNLLFVLSGDLGAGKTTLVQQVARLLKVTDQVVSPTFSIMKWYDTEHQIFKKLIHIDLYRIESEQELGPLRFKEIITTPNALVCVEWPERAPDHGFPSAVWVKIQNLAGEKRQITIEQLSESGVTA